MVFERRRVTVFIGFVEFLEFIGLMKQVRVESGTPFANGNSMNSRNTMNTINTKNEKCLIA
jgi:hypothetical protein